jgi:hypothetical protein
LELTKIRAKFTSDPWDGGRLVYSISQVRVPFEIVYLLNFFRMGTGVTQDEQSIADVNDVDHSIPDNRVAPHDDLCLEVGIGGIWVQDLGRR